MNHTCLKQETIAALLSLRKDDPDLWTLGSYEPFPIRSYDDGLFAFRRRNAPSTLLVLINRTVSSGRVETVTLDAEYSDVLTGSLHGPGDTLR